MDILCKDDIHIMMVTNVILMAVHMKMFMILITDILIMKIATQNLNQKNMDTTIMIRLIITNVNTFESPRQEREDDSKKKP